MVSCVFGSEDEVGNQHWRGCASIVSVKAPLEPRSRVRAIGIHRGVQDRVAGGKAAGRCRSHRGGRDNRGGIRRCKSFEVIEKLVSIEFGAAPTVGLGIEKR